MDDYDNVLDYYDDLYGLDAVMLMPVELVEMLAVDQEDQEDT